MSKYTIGKDIGQLLSRIEVLEKRVAELEGIWDGCRDVRQSNDRHYAPRKVNVDHAKLVKQLKLHEGVKHKVYVDTQGHKTIGVGFNLEKEGAEERIVNLGVDYQALLNGEVSLTDAQIDTLLDVDIAIAVEDSLSVFGDISVLSDVRQRVLIDMTFNLGKTRISKFVKLIEAIKTAVKMIDSVVEHEAACSRAEMEMKSSTWCGQVKKRCTTLRMMMKNNVD